MPPAAASFRSRRLLAVLATGVALAVLGAGLSRAQEADDASPANAPLIAPQRNTQAQQPAQPGTAAAGETYQPASAGAVPDPDDAPATEDNIFSEEPVIRLSQPDASDTADRATRRSPRATTATGSRTQAAEPAGGRAGEAGRDATRAEDATPAAVAAERRTPPSTAPDAGDATGAELETGRALRVVPLEAPAAALVSAPEDPFEPLGIRLGSFVLRPTVEQGLGASTNASNSAAGEEGVYSETVLRLEARSDWAEHEAELSGYGTLRKPISGDEDVDEVNAGLDARMRFDLADGWIGRTGLAYLARPESAASPVPLAAGAEDRPLRQTLDAEAGIERRLGLIRVGATAALERDWYGDVSLVDGSELSQAERDSTLVSLRTRMGYELSPALVPFVELETGRRFFDVETDSAGIERSSLRGAIRAGVELDLREKLGGEVSLGYLREEFEDDDLEAAKGVTVDANLRWSPDRRTAVGLRGSTTVEGTTTAGESGSLLYEARADLERTLLANLSGNAAFGTAFRDYVGSDGRDVTLFAETGLVWWFNRNFGLSSRVRYEQLESNLEGRDYDATSVFLGLRAQR